MRWLSILPLLAASLAACKADYREGTIGCQLNTPDVCPRGWVCEDRNTAAGARPRCYRTARDAGLGGLSGEGGTGGSAPRDDGAGMSAAAGDGAANGVAGAGRSGNGGVGTISDGIVADGGNGGVRATSGSGGVGVDNGGSGAGMAGSAGGMAIDPCTINNGECDPLVKCTAMGDSIACSACPTGYDDMNGNGTSCVDVDECKLSTFDCKPHSSCVNTPGTYACPCDVGFHGDGRQQCMANVVCVAGGSNCASLATCNDVNGIKYCVCSAGYEGDGETCADIDECLANNGGCDTSPNAACSNKVGDVPSCGCPSGYSGNGVGDTGCIDIDECAGVPSASCGAGATGCTNTPGSYSCTCGGGYSGTGTAACADINECAGVPTAACGAGATACANTPGGYSCTCGGGYSGTGTTACADVDECTGAPSGACGAGATACANTPGSYSCTCDGGYSGTGTTACTDINECAGMNVCTTDCPCQLLPPYYTCRGQFADWTTTDSPTMFIDNGNQTVTDSRSGLVWQSTLPVPYQGCSGTFNSTGDSCTWAEAKAYCTGLRLAGMGWRLPALPELESIVDFGKFNSAINNAAFFDTGAAEFWTSTSHATVSGYAWYVGFNDGASSYATTNTYSRVRCVASSASVTTSSGSGGTPPGRYTTSSDTVYDNRTKLTWQRTVYANSITQAQAITYCTSGSMLAGSGWRLPKVSELLTIADRTKPAQPAIDTEAFPNTAISNFWTSSPHVSTSVGDVWAVDFSVGASINISASFTNRIRCVR
jgi:hypothetical protein